MSGWGLSIRRGAHCVTNDGMLFRSAMRTQATGSRVGDLNS